MNNDLYGKFEDHELCGDGYFNATVDLPNGQKEREVIVQKVDETQYLWCAIWIPADLAVNEANSWRKPTPTYQPDEKIFFKFDQLRNLVPRPVMETNHD